MIVGPAIVLVAHFWTCRLPSHVNHLHHTVIMGITMRGNREWGDNNGKAKCWIECDCVKERIIVPCQKIAGTPPVNNDDFHMSLMEEIGYGGKP